MNSTFPQSTERVFSIANFKIWHHLRFVCVLAVVLGTSCNDDRPDRPTVTANNSTNGADQETENADYPMSVQSEPAGSTEVGQGITRFILTNKNGVRVTLINYGAIVTSVEVPDRDGKFENVVLGFEDVDGFLKNGPYFGAVCGRYANRIAGGKFTLNGQGFTLAVNNPPNHLHGGTRGLDKALWNAESFDAGTSVGVRLNYISPDGDEGYPGELDVTVVYSLTTDNEFRIEYTAMCDKATPINLTNHCYWNLAGVREETPKVLDHVLILNCDKYLAVDKDSIPTGIADVRDSPMDFTTAVAIGSRISEVGSGYDHCFVVNKSNGRDLVKVAEIRDPESGRVMQISTTEPGVQFYTGNFLDGSEESGGFNKHEGFCLECQHYPDSPNQPDFPNTILRPNEVYSQKTVHKFSVSK